MRRTFACCGRIAHQDCWKRQFLIADKPAPLGGAKCEDVVTFLKKDRMSPDHTASINVKAAADPTVDLRCDLCDMDLSTKVNQSETEKSDVKEHYVKKCPAVPGTANLGTMNRKEILERIAALSLIKKVGKLCETTNRDVKRVFVFTGKTASSSSEEVGVRPCENPPD